MQLCNVCMRQGGREAVGSCVVWTSSASSGYARPRPLLRLLLLPSQADERDIFKFFSAVGTVNDIKLITDKHTKKSKGIAYIEFSTQEEVFMAITTLNGAVFQGMPVMVSGGAVHPACVLDAHCAAVPAVWFAGTAGWLRMSPAKAHMLMLGAASC